MFGLLAILLILNDKFVLSAVSGAIAAAFWHIALIFCVVPILYIIKDRQWKKFAKTSIIILLLITIILLPIIASNATNQLVAEVIIAPFLIPEAIKIYDRLENLRFILKFSIIPLSLGIVGFLLAFTEEKYGKPYWLMILSAWFFFQVFLLDFDGPPDLFAWFTILTIGTGFTLDHRPVIQWPMVSIVSAGVLVMSIWLGYVLYTGDTTAWPGFGQEISTGGNPSVSHLNETYWNKTKSESCHIRLSGLEKNFINHVEETRSSTKCGKYNLKRLIKISLS